MEQNNNFSQKNIIDFIKEQDNINFNELISSFMEVFNVPNQKPQVKI